MSKISPLDAFKNLTERERKKALEILDQSIETENMDAFVDFMEDYDEIPVDIDTFIESPDYLGLMLDSGNTIFPRWREELRDIFHGPNKYTEVIFTGGIGLGKAQPLDCKVFTSNGFKLMRDITLDDKVYGKDGNLHKVLGIYPQGVKDVYRVTFSDGTSTKCCKEHLWNVKHRKKQDFETLSLGEILEKGYKFINKTNKSINRIYKIPICDTLKFKSSKVILNPYLLGCLIGDGSMTSGNINFSSVDTEILDRLSLIISEYGCVFNKKSKKLNSYDYSISRKVKTGNTINPIRTAIKKMSLNCYSYNKFIPKEYIYNSKEVRLELLQGLMDTDGYIGEDGYYGYTTTSEKLAKDVEFLVMTLGGTTKTSKKVNRGYKNAKGILRPCRDAYDVRIILPSKYKPFKLQRKLDRLKINRLEPRRYIDDIILLGKEECQCIYLDGEEHLYLTDNLIVTHNTTIASIGMTYVLYKMMCLKNPRKYYKCTEDGSDIVFAFFNVYKYLAEANAYKMVQGYLKKSPWFKRNGKITGSLHQVYRPNKEIAFTLGAGSTDALGMDIFCITGDNKILINTDNGYEYVRIDSVVNKLIRILAYDEETNEITEAENPCEVFLTKYVSELVKITLEDGSTITCTPDHQIMMEDGSYVQAQDIIEGNEVKSINKEITNEY